MLFLRNKRGNLKQDVMRERQEVRKGKLPRYVMTSDEKLDIARYFVPIIVMVLIIIIELMIGKIILGPTSLKITEQSVQLTQLKTDYDLMTNQYRDMVSQRASLDDYSYYTGDTSENDLAASDFFHISVHGVTAVRMNHSVRKCSGPDIRRNRA